MNVYKFKYRVDLISENVVCVLIEAPDVLGAAERFSSIYPKIGYLVDVELIEHLNKMEMRIGGELEYMTTMGS